MAYYNYRYDDDYDPYEYEYVDEFDEEEFMIEYKDELLSLEDFEEMWLAICELFPEYDFLSYLEEFEETYNASYGLRKFKNPSEYTLRREKEGIKEFFKGLDGSPNIGDLNAEIVITLIEKGRYYYKDFPADEEVGDFYGDWEGEIYIPRLNDDVKTKELNKKLLKPVIDNFVSAWGKIK